MASNNLADMAVSGPPSSPERPEEDSAKVASVAGSIESPWKCTRISTRACEWPTLNSTNRRVLTLLELPVDILTEIIGHLPHANDLTALALTHSVLHSLAIPSIYSRFDIVWPDQGMQSETRAGVDALTYGLATLVKSQEIFGEAAARRMSSSTTSVTDASSQFRHLYPIRRRRLGNDYANYTRKFSLGNGPLDCVREYLIIKEGGKMLGTLVSLAVARMRNLESFVWDMPTGILRDVWLALSSLDGDGRPEPHKLERLWIRWHNNWLLEHAEAPPPPPPSVPPPVLAQSHRSHLADGNVPMLSSSNMPPLSERVEHPSLSIVPAVKSLTVLEVDELVYLDEMAILVARSAHLLKELRLGVARHTRDMAWTKNWEGREYHQVDHSTTWTIASKIGDKRLQGVLGVLVGRMHNLKNNAETIRAQKRIKYLAKVQERAQQDNDANEPTAGVQAVTSNFADDLTFHISATAEAGLDQAAFSGAENDTGILDGDGADVASRVANISLESHPIPSSSPPALFRLDKVSPLRPAKQLRTDFSCAASDGPYLNGVLKLNVLELERVYLSLPVIRSAFDFSNLTSLTLINCQNHERLWKDLRRRYSQKAPRKPNKHSLQPPGGINLKRVHTDTPSASLLKFLRETLRPNTLEALFLQDRWGVLVSISDIFDTVVVRHRSSLKQLLIDSSQLEERFTEPSNRWRKWRLTRKMVAYITSGKLPRLRELAVNIDYADWHIFLQRLFRVPTLRSIYIPHIADHPSGNNVDTHDLALQIVDIITLRPEIELCYMGLGQKCFEILETKRTRNGNRESMSSIGSTSSTSHSDRDNSRNHPSHSAEDSSSDEEEDEQQSSGDESENGWSTADDGANEDENVFGFDRDGDEISESDEEADRQDDEAIEDGHDDESSGGEAGVSTGALCGTSKGSRLSLPRLRLQEILFYDKIAIFKARHGRL